MTFWNWFLYFMFKTAAWSPPRKHWGYSTFPAITLWNYQEVPKVLHIGTRGFRELNTISTLFHKEIPLYTHRREKKKILSCQEGSTKPKSVSCHGSPNPLLTQNSTSHTRTVFLKLAGHHTAHSAQRLAEPATATSANWYGSCDQQLQRLPCPCVIKLWRHSLAWEYCCVF